MLIGITGLAGHGKDTFAGFLQECLPKPVPMYAYADPIKDIVHSSFKAEHSPTTREHKEMEQTFTFSYYAFMQHLLLNSELKRACWGMLSPSKSFMDTLSMHLGTDLYAYTSEFKSSWRQLYQLTGTEWGRQQVDLDMWINMAPKDNAIITDVRGQGDHPVDKNTEALHVKNNGGIMIKVVNPRLQGPTCAQHSSEAEIDEKHIDFNVENSGSIRHLQQLASQLAEVIKEN